MRIYNNINAVATQNTLGLTNSRMQKSLERLSTGMRINRSSDDAAGLSVSEGLRSQIRGSGMAQRNANDGLAMLQIAESGTQQITDSLQRMRELAIQASNGTYTNTDRGYINQEYAALASEVTRIASGTSYNGVQLLSTSTAFSFQISSAKDGNSSTISFTPTDLSTGLSFGGVSSQSAAQSAISSIDSILASVLSLRSNIGSTMNRLDATVSNLGNMITNLTDAESRIRDTDFAQETMQFTRNQILTQSATAMMSQANQLPSGVLNLLR
ncbi:MAG TPA: flagellin [Fibrobacteria bacterium]|nr:flagellin [Fibrobacteria bacterium]